MLKVLRIPALFTIVMLLLLSCNNHVPPEAKGGETEVEAEKEDGIEQAIEQEFKMTVDPALNTVPVERLAAARQTAESLRAANTNKTTSIAWEERGPNNIAGRTRAILVDKNDPTGNTVFAGSVGGGIWKCNNFKDAASYSWAKMNDNMENLAISSIAQDPLQPNLMYAGTGEGFNNADAIRGGGIFKSVDGGSTWLQLPATVPSWTAPTNYNFGYVQDIAITPTAVYAAARATRYCNYGGVFKSIDQGTTWTRVIQYTTSSTCIGAGNDLEIAANGDLYATTGLNGGTGSTYNYGRIWKSPAALGASQGEPGQWTDITPTPPSGEPAFKRIEIACAPGNDQMVYAVCQRYNASDVSRCYKSSDGGTTWTAIVPPTWCDQGTIRTDFTRSQAWYDLIAAYDPANSSKIYIGGVDLMSSSDGGSTFTQLTRWSTFGCGSLPYIHADNHNIVFINGSSNDMIATNDGGVFYSGDGGQTFGFRGNGYNVTQYYGLAIHPAAGSDYMLAGAQDNGSHRFNAPGINTITKVGSGDGMLCYIDQSDPAYQIYSTPYCNYKVSRNGGTSFSYTVSNSSGDFTNPGDYDNANGYLYCGYDAGTYGQMECRFASSLSINSINVPAASGMYVSTVKSDPNVSGRAYMAFYNGVPIITRVDNAQTASPSFTDVSIPGLASGSYIASIDVQSGDANHLLATLSNYGITSVYESTDGGTSWTDIEGNLPDIPVRAGIFLPTNGRIALGTELGVWTTTDPVGTTPVWLPDNNGLANVRVDMIRLRTSDNTIGVATHGRGVFTSNLNIVPVTLLGLNGVIKNGYAALEWKTATEANSSHFEVEKSYDGGQYHKVGIVKAAGNSNDIRTYTYPDNEKAAEINYYRLKMVDKDGRHTYSNVVKLQNSRQLSMQAVNPFGADIEVQFSVALSGKVTLQLSDMSGR